MHSGLNFFDEHLTAEQLVERKLVPFTKSGLDQMRYLGRASPYLEVGYKVFYNVDSVRAWLKTLERFPGREPQTKLRVTKMRKAAR
jgi:hypothetical protein